MFICICMICRKYMTPPRASRRRRRRWPKAVRADPWLTQEALQDMLPPLLLIITEGFLCETASTQMLFGCVGNFCQYEAARSFA